MSKKHLTYLLHHDPFWTNLRSIDSQIDHCTALHLRRSPYINCCFSCFLGSEQSLGCFRMCELIIFVILKILFQITKFLVFIFWDLVEIYLIYSTKTWQVFWRWGHRGPRFSPCLGAFFCISSFKNHCLILCFLML